MAALSELFLAIKDAFEENVITTATQYGLQDSQLVKNIKVTVSDDSISISAPDYLTFVQNGVRKGALKGVWVPIAALLKFMKKRGIAPGQENKVVWAIRHKIHAVGINGYPGRPFVNEAIDMTLNDKTLDIKFDAFVTEKLKNLLK